MLTRMIEVLTASILIAQFGVIAISLFWSFLILDTPTMALLQSLTEFKPLLMK